MNIRSLRRLVAVLCALLCVRTSSSQQHVFSVEDDIAIVRFGNLWGGTLDGGVLESPDGQWLAVHAVRADLGDDLLHDQLRFYRSKELLDATDPSDVKPVWITEESVLPLENIDAALIQLKWIGQNRLAFLKWSAKGNKQLFLADPLRRDIRALTDPSQDVISYAISDEKNFVYTTPAEEVKKSVEDEQQRPSIVVGDREAFRFLFPAKVSNQYMTDLWSVRGEQVRRIDDPETHKPFRVLGDGLDNLSLSPNGEWIATIRPYPSIPESWLEKYPSPDATSMYRLKSGPQDLNLAVNWGVVGEYVVIDTKTGDTRSLMHGPNALRLGWLESFVKMTWSPDGERLFLPASFADTPLTTDNRPCSAVVEVRTFRWTCMRPLRRNLATTTESGYMQMYSAQFLGKSTSLPTVELEIEQNHQRQFVHFVQSKPGTWAEEARSANPANPVRFEVVQDMNRPPVLVRVASSLHQEAVVFDPNPHLRQIPLGHVEEYQWSDDTHHWSGLLYRPIGYRRGAKYPLVIQNHGYDPGDYMPSGRIPSAFVAEELAVKGVMVLQVRDCAGRGTVFEAPCNVSAYDAAIKRLAEEEGADLDHVGIIGFSRTVLYVMRALETSKIHFAAALINDGLSDSYLSYILNVGGLTIGAQDAEGLVGGKPLGSGMTAWLKNAPDFNTEAITTPLRIVSEKGYGMLAMWEPYARLKLGGQPTELVVLNTESHLIAQPTIRRVSQQGTLDWFRFWLQDFEDPDPSKIDQYVRWKKMRVRSSPLSANEPMSGRYH
jgi:dipeptidyl aminopeptidase/acylaminoacyl peptidase